MARMMPVTNCTVKHIPAILPKPQKEFKNVGHSSLVFKRTKQHLSSWLAEDFLLLTSKLALPNTFSL